LNDVRVVLGGVRNCALVVGTLRLWFGSIYGDRIGGPLSLSATAEAESGIPPTVMSRMNIVITVRPRRAVPVLPLFEEMFKKFVLHDQY